MTTPNAMPKLRTPVRVTERRFASRAVVFRFALASWAMAVAADATAQLNLPQFFSPTPVGSGARAAGMANAFVAVADDATSASWNPAGLVQLEVPEFSIVGAYTGTRETFSNVELDPEFPSNFASTHRDGNLRLNFLSVVYPTYFWNRNVVFSLSYQERLQFDRRFDIRHDVFDRGLDIIDRLEAHVNQDGSFSVITPSVAVSVTQTFSLGLSANLWRSTPISENDFEVLQIIDQKGFEPDGEFIGQFTRSIRDKYDDFSGENFVIGALWSATPRWNLAFRYDTAFTGRTDFSRRLFQGGSFVIGGTQTSFIEERRHLRLPATFAIGTSYRFSDRFTTSLDMSRTDWNNAYVRTGDGTRLSLVDGSDLDGDAATHFDPVYSVRLGAEYVFIPKILGERLDALWTLRGGLFFEQEPASGRSVTADGELVPGDGKPDTFWGAAVGVGLLARQRVNIDAAYQLRWGPNVNSDFIQGIYGFNEDVIQHRFLVSLVVYLGQSGSRSKD